MKLIFSPNSFSLDVKLDKIHHSKSANVKYKVKTMFQLNPRLKQDSLFICDLECSQLRLLNDSRYIWCLLIPRRIQSDGTDISELHQLDLNDQQIILHEINQISHMIESQFTPDKLNIGALGNIVPQLHIHIIGRRNTDPAWPGPVWGHSPATAYTKEEAGAIIENIRHFL